MIITFGILITLLFSAFFSGIEIAFISANRLKIAINKEQGGLSHRILAYFSEKPSWFIGCLLLGNNVAIVIYSIYMAELIDPWLSEFISSKALILFIQTLIATLILLIFAEFLPKAIFRINANNILTIMATPLFLIYIILSIPTFITIGLAELVLKLFISSEDGDTEGKVAFEKVDLDIYLEEGILASDESDEDTDDEVKLFKKAINFSEVIARDCMVPRNEIIALEINDEIDELHKLFSETGLSKILIYKETIDNIIGYVHIFDMLTKPKDIKSALLPVSVIPESMTVSKVLEDLIKKNRSIAVVLDEYGGTAGMITMEDIIEEIFGEIEDEHDVEEIINEKLGPNEYRFGARLEIDFLNEEYNFRLPESEEYETLAGFIIHQLEDLPEEKEQIFYENYKLVIEQMSQNKIEVIKFFIIEDDL